MSDKQQMKIEYLPEVFELQKDDEIYLFKENSGKATKIQIPISMLSTYFHSKDTTEKLKAKVVELQNLSAQFTNWLKTNYPDADYVTKNYTKVLDFLDVYNVLQAESDYSIYLEEYATKEYGQIKLAEVKAHHEIKRLENTIDQGTSIMTELKNIEES